MAVKAVPEGYHTVTPYLMMKRAGEAIDFYKKAFGATEIFRMEAPGDKVGHAEIRIGDSMIMLADEYPEEGFVGPETLGGSPISILLYVDDVDTMFAQAIEAGATELKPLTNQFYGDRSGLLRDPFGHFWTLSTHVEDVSEEEMERRMKEQTHS